MDRETILDAAKTAPAKTRIEEHREAVEILRGKGYTWREIADFLNKQGVQTDHTRIYRTFGKKTNNRKTETRDINIEKITFVGIRKTKKNNTWNVLEFLLPSQLGKPLTVVGYAWGRGSAQLEVKEDQTIAFRNPTLVIKSGDGFPVSYIKADLKSKDDEWSPNEIYIMPKWEELL